MKLIKINSTIPVATWANASTVFDRSDVRFVGYNLALGRIYAFYLCLCGLVLVVALRWIDAPS
jgi:hypothetical protein